MNSNSDIAPAPHAIIAEKSVLSVMFRQPVTIAKAAAEGITADAFHIPAHRTILAHLIRCRDADHLTHEGEIDISVFVQSAQIEGIIDRMGGAGDVYGVFTYATSASGWSAWCDQLRECKARRIALEASKALSDATDSEEAIHTAQAALEAIKNAVAGPRRATASKHAVERFSDKLKADHQAGDYPGRETGIHALDEISGGMRPGEFWVFGGRPSDGKSVILLQIASELIERGDPVAIFTLEMQTTEIIGRLVSKMGRVDYGSITQPKHLNKADLAKIQSTAAVIAGAKLWIDDSSGQNLDTITAEATRIRDSHGSLALVVVDYIQLIRDKRSRDELREQEVARTSGGLKQLAKALGCPVLSASQLNDDGRVRESRAITHDADSVLIIAEDGIKVMKMRNGQRGAVLPLKLDGRFQRFTERHS